MSFIIILGLIICIYVLSIIFSLSSIWIMKYIEDIKFYCKFIYKIIYHKIYFLLQGEYKVGGIFIDGISIVKVVKKDISLKCCDCFYNDGNCTYEGIICMSKFGCKNIIFQRIGLMYNCYNCINYACNINVRFEKINCCRLNQIFKMCKKGELFVYKNKYLRLLNFLKGGITLFDEKEKLK